MNAGVSAAAESAGQEEKDDAEEARVAAGGGAGQAAHADDADPAAAAAAETAGDAEPPLLRVDFDRVAGVAPALALHRGRRRRLHRRHGQVRGRSRCAANSGGMC